MEETLVPLGVFAMIAYVVHAIVSGLVRSRLITRQSQVLIRLIESAGPTATSGLLESPAGRALIDGHVDRRTLVLNRVLSALQAFLVLMALGGALLFFQNQFTAEDERTALRIMGLLSLAVGLAFLLAAGLSYALSRRWNLIKAGETGG
jgi:hypothetical protein